MEDAEPVQLEDFRWATLQVVRDWVARQPKQFRKTLPPQFTAPKLRYIRINACRDTAPKTIECGKWTQTDPYPLDPDRWGAPEVEPIGPFPRTAQYVCDQCKHPVVKMEMLISKLYLTDERPKFSPRTFQRYMNAEEPMPIDLFQRAISNAFTQRWISVQQVMSIQSNLTDIVASGNSLIALYRRFEKRKAPLEGFDIQKEFEDELAKQLRLLDRESTANLHRRLKNPDLNAELRDVIEEQLARSLATRQAPTAEGTETVNEEQS